MRRDQGNSSTSSAPSTPTVDELVARYENMVTRGRILAPMAADNLQHWLDATGRTKIIPSHHFQNDTAVTSHLRDVHRRLFLSQRDALKGILPRLRRPPVASTYQMTWEDSTYAQPLSDLYFGLGGFTLKSIVEVAVAQQSSNTWNVTFVRWTAQVFDVYNWDDGKSVWVPGWGTIDDTDAIRVEQAGRARSYLIESFPWFVTDPAIMGPATVTT